MRWMDRLDHNTAQMNRMAATIGLDLESAMVRGILPPHQLRSAMLRCTGCERPGACAVWLDRANGEAEAPPAWCANSELMRATRREAGAE